MEETAEIAAKGATITLSGIPSNLISLAITEPYQGRLCKIMFGAIDANREYLLQEDGSFVATDPIPKQVNPGLRLDCAAGKR